MTDWCCVSLPRVSLPVVITITIHLASRDQVNTPPSWPTTLLKQGSTQLHRGHIHITLTRTPTRRPQVHTPTRLVHTQGLLSRVMAPHGLILIATTFTAYNPTYSRDSAGTAVASGPSARAYKKQSNLKGLFTKERASPYPHRLAQLTLTIQTVILSS